MAYFAKLDENNIVTHVVSVKDNECVDVNGVETDEQGQNFLRFVHKEPNAIWKQCSYNTRNGVHTTWDVNGTIVSQSEEKSLRGNFPTIGYSYDEALDIFVSSKEYPSWILHTEASTDLYKKYDWRAPIDPPTIHVKNDVMYLTEWDESNQRWTAYLIDDNEIQYVWNASTLAWDLL